MKAIIKFFSDIRYFITCCLKDKCDYSSKKILAYLFSFVIIYLVIFTEKSVIDLLVFVTVLLGLRSYDTSKNQGTSYINKEENKG
jgi:hypothetical protein